MRNRIMTALSIFVLLLGVGLLTAPTASSAGGGGTGGQQPPPVGPPEVIPLAKTSGLVTGLNYCVADPFDLTYTLYTYTGSNQATFLGNIVRGKPGSPYVCSNLNGIGLSATEKLFGAPAPGSNGTDSSQVPVPNVPTAAELQQVDPASLPQAPTAQSNVQGQVCVANPNDPNLIHWGFFAEGDAFSESSLAGMIVRIMPNTVHGCQSFNGIPLQEWELLYAGVAPDYVGPDSWMTGPENTARTLDNPLLETYQPKPLGAGGLVGCSGWYRLQTSMWVKDWIYQDINPISKLPRFVEVRLVANAIYYYCPQGPAVDKVKPLAVSYCTSHLTQKGKGYLFSGTRWNPYFADYNTKSNPGDFTVSDNDGLQQCAVQDVEGGIERWLRLDQSAQWGLIATIKRNIIPDEDVIFDTVSGAKRKQFNPDSDPILSEWRQS